MVELYENELKAYKEAHGEDVPEEQVSRKRARNQKETVVPHVHDPPSPLDAVGNTNDEFTNLLKMWYECGYKTALYLSRNGKELPDTPPRPPL